MSTPKDPREARLPKWAQAELERLRDANLRLREDFEEFADTNTPEDVFAVVEPYDEHPKPAARDGQTVRFYLDGLDGWRWVDVRQRDDGLIVRAGAGLRLKPEADNSLHLDLDRT